jgi:hypothetical protein
MAGWLPQQWFDRHIFIPTGSVEAGTMSAIKTAIIIYLK